MKNGLGKVQAELVWLKILIKGFWKYMKKIGKISTGVDEPDPNENEQCYCKGH